MFYEETFKREEVLIYLRKSRSDDPALSVEEVLEKHEAILNEWCDNHLGGRVPEENVFREVASGETIKDRPEIQRLLRRIESPAITAVLVVEVQRISRGDLEDAGRLIKLFWHSGTRVITPMKTFNLDNEYDRDFFERELKRGNEFLEYQKKIMMRGRLLSVSQGNYIGSIPPYGYDKTFIMEGKKKIPTLKINEEEAAVVRMIFDMYVNENIGVNLIARRLDELHIIPRGKGVNWSSAAIKDMLTNVTYIGKVKWNWRKSVTIVKDSEFISTRPKSSDYQIFDGKHEAIISEDLFKAAESKRGRCHRAKGTTKVRNPFAGLIYCRCGRAMTYRTYMRDGIQRSAPRLLCDNQVNCGVNSCLYSDLEELVVKMLKSSIRDFKVKVKRGDPEEVEAHKKLIGSLRAKLEKVKEKEIAQWEQYTSPDSFMPEHVFKKLNENIVREKESITAALDAELKNVPATVDYEEKISRFQKALDALRDDRVPAERKNALLKSCIERITYDRGKLLDPEGNEYKKKAGKIRLEVKLFN